MSSTQSGFISRESIIESGSPLSSEYYTYYPTWTTGVEQQQQPIATGVRGVVGVSGVRGVVGPLEDVVITGVSGRFPGCETVEEFAQKLYNGVELVGEKSLRGGLLGEVPSKWSSELIGVTPSQYEVMDPQVKKLLEVSYEAIFDSGLNPIELKGSRTGVFIGTNTSETMLHDDVSGLISTMLANRLSYHFELKGPSYTFDSVPTSSLVGLDLALNAIKSGQCEYALVGAINFLKNVEPVQVAGQVPFTVSVVLLQKRSTCRRFYAKVLHSKVFTDALSREQGILNECGQIQTRLLKEVYGECNIDPSLVTYVESHLPGQGSIVVGQELAPISEVFVSPRVQRSVPLFVGSTKSFQGYQEQGICALVKMLISIQRGVIPANLQYQEPIVGRGLQSLVDGRLRIVNGNTKFRGGLMALSAYGVGGGVYSHVLLQPNSEYIITKLGNGSLWNEPELGEISRLPRLFPFCGRSQQGVERVIEHVRRVPTDLATHCLLQPNAVSPVLTHPYRGFTILNGKQVIQEVQRVEVAEPRPVWYVFNGIGAEWQGMGQELMTLDVFRQSILRSVQVLRPYGVDLLDLIYGKQQSVVERTLNWFVGVTAVQIALVDALRHTGVQPEGLIGHSIGEIACAYADNCLSAEEALLTAYHRGRIIEEVQLPLGAMATVGLTWEECKRRCPVGIVPAIHNSLDTVVVSGPRQAVVEFVEQLKSEGVFAKEIESRIAFHSHYMTKVAPQLRVALEKVILKPRQRSGRWISTSVPEQRWSSELGRLSSPEYFVNNLCSPVLFQESLRHIPTNAIVVEIGPHALLHSVLRRSLAQQIPVIPLIKRDAVYPLEHFLTQLGRLYVEGVNLDAVKLVVPFGREQTIYPVPVQTGFLSHLIRGDHVPTWTTPLQSGVYGIESGVHVPVTYKYNVDLIEDAYLTGHQIDGRILYPTTGYLYLIWKSLAQLKGYKTFEQMPISFENVEFHRCTVLPTTGMPVSRVVESVVGPKRVEFVVRIVQKTGLFELVEGGNVIVSGRVFVPETVGVVGQQQPLVTMTGRKFFEQEEIYRELRTRGYEYQGEFQPILKADVEGTCGELLWTGKWVPFLESMLQMNVFGQKRGLLLPTRIRSIKIDPIVHLQTPRLRVVRPEMIGLVGTGIERPCGVFQAVFDQLTNTTVCGGIEINGLHTIVTPRLSTFVQQPYNISYPLVPTCPVTYPVTYPVGCQYNETYPTIPTIPSCMENVCFNPIQTYVITGGLAGFGLELAHWMVERGARRIIITSKVGVRSEYQVRKLRILRDEFNAQIQVLPLNVNQEVECLTLIKEAAQMSIENRIGGIFHLSGIWEELPYEIQQQMQQQQVQQQIRKLVDNVKCLGTFNLDKYIRSECVMDESGYFVVFVPVFGSRTTVVPTPYTTIEKVCELRRREGRHAMCVQWGFNTELGLTHESLFGGEYETYTMPTTGVVLPKRILPCLRVLENLLVKSWEPKELYTTYIPIEKILNHQEIYGQYPTGQFVASQPRSLVEYVLGVLGVNDFKTVVCNEKLCLGELGLDSVKCIEIKKIFEQVYNLPFTPKEIQEMTIEKIRSIELCQQPTRILPTLPFLPVTGVNGIYPTTGVTGVYQTTGVTGVYQQTGVTGVYPTTGVTGVYQTTGVTGVYPTTGVNGIYPTTGVTGVYPTTTGVMPRMYTTRKVNYLMPTRVIERLNQIEMTPQQVPVVVIHPIEGHVNMLRSWAKQMKYPVFGVQFTQEAMQYESVEQLAEFYWTQIEKEIFRQSTGVVVPRIHLCGYSFGSPVAFEMAGKRHGRVASLTFLDGCHSYVNGQLSVFRNRFPMVELVNRIGEVESEILYTFVQQYVPTMVTKREFVEELVRLSTLEQRIRYVVRELLSKSQFQFDQFDLELAARSYVNKMLMAIKYQPRQQLVNLPELLLIKSTGPLNLYEQLYGQDYGLGKVFGGKVLVKCVEGDNRSFLEGTNGYQVANILNEYFVRCF